MNKTPKPCSFCQDLPDTVCGHGKRLHLNGLRCCACKKVKPKESFNANKSRPDGFHTSCKECMKALPARGEYADKKKELETDEKTKYFLEYQYMCGYTKKVFMLTKEQFIAIISKPCYYCNDWLSGKDFCGIDRIDRTKEYKEDNCIPCCELCSGMRRIIDKDLFLSHIARIYKNKLL
jgi:hypothetical protein